MLEELTTCDTADVLVEEISNEEYQKRPAYSRSMIVDWLGSPREFEGKYITKTIPPKESQPMDIGDVSHAAIIADRPLVDVVLEIPEEVLTKNGAKNGNAWRDFKEAHADRILLKAEEYKKVLAIRDAVLSHPLARLYFEADGLSEKTITWTCPETGASCRCRVDKLIEGLIIDLKTSHESAGRSFRWSAIDYGYDIQDAHYREGVKMWTSEPHDLIFVVAPNKPPFKPVRVYVIEPARKAFAEANRTMALGQMLRAAETGDYSDPGENEITELTFYQRS